MEEDKTDPTLGAAQRVCNSRDHAVIDGTLCRVLFADGQLCTFVRGNINWHSPDIDHNQCTALFAARVADNHVFVYNCLGTAACSKTADVALQQV